MNFQTLNRQRKFILIAAFAGLVAMFLPWVTVSTGGIFEGISEGGMSQNGMHGAGILVFLSFLCAVVLAFRGEQTRALDKTNWLVALTAGAVALLFAVIVLSGTPTGDLGVVKSSVGYGAWIALLAAVGVLASAWLLKNPADTIKGSFDKLKNDLTK
jgi:magnesium-transporting ATPase (P-type)